MTIFTSTAREDVNRTDYYAPDAFEAWPVDTVRPEDPEPFYVARRGDGMDGTPYRTAAPEGVLAPRPGYRAPQNPILAAFRADNPAHGMEAGSTVIDLARVYLNGLDDGDFDRTEGTLPEHIDHARKVLTRLANIYKEA